MLATREDTRLATSEDVARKFVSKHPAIVGTVVLMSEKHSLDDGYGQPVDGEDQMLNSEIIRSYIRQLGATKPNLNTILVEDGFADMMEMTHTMNRQKEYGIFLQSHHIDIFLSTFVVMTLLSFSKREYESAFTCAKSLWVLCSMIYRDTGISIVMSIFPEDFNSIVSFGEKMMFILSMVRQNSIVQWLKIFSDSYNRYRIGNSYANEWFISMLNKINKINVYSHNSPIILNTHLYEIQIVRDYYMCKYAVAVSQSFDIVFLIVGHSHRHAVYARMLMESESNNVEMLRAVPLTFYDDQGDYWDVDTMRRMSEILAELIADDENIQWSSYLRPLQNGARLRF